MTSLPVRGQINFNKNENENKIKFNHSMNTFKITINQLIMLFYCSL